MKKGFFSTFLYIKGGGCGSLPSLHEALPPTDFYPSTWSWAANLVDIQPYYKEFYTDSNTQYQIPKGPDNSTPWEFHYDFYGLNPRPFVAIIPEGRILGPNGAVLSQDNKLLWDLSMEYERSTPREHSIFSQQKLPPLSYTTETLGVLTFVASHNYFHWLLDVLPRIDLIHKAGIPIEKFIFNTNPLLSFQSETLTALGITNDMRVMIQGNIHVRAKNLVVPSLIGYRSRYPQWASLFVRNELLKKFNVKKLKEYERIYVSRDDANIRKVTNEDEVMRVLGKYGFKRIILKNMSVAEQIQKFHSAKVVVSPHGANLTNLLFCDRGTKVIELFSPSHIHPVYWLISNHVGLDYYYVVGEGNRPPRNVLVPYGGWANIKVNVDLLETTIKMMNL
jgi:hypothetical protein